MSMHIQFNTAELSEEDIAMLRTLVGGTTFKATAASPSAAAPVAKKTAAKKAAAAPAPVVEEEDEDVLGGDSTEEFTMGDAVARATELVGDGQAKRVKAALADLGVGKVSELKSDEDITSFVVSLQD